MALRDSELFIELPEVEAASPALRAAPGLTPLPGCVVVQMDAERQSFGHLHLPDQVKGRTRPDAGVILAVGSPKQHQSGSFEPVELMPGDRVLVRPYHGLWLEKFMDSQGNEYLDLRLYGVTRPWSQSILAQWVENRWIPTRGWFLIRRESNEASPGGVILSNPRSKPRATRARIVATSDPERIPEGCHILCDSDSNASLELRFGNLKGFELLQEISDDGIQQIWAILNDN